MRSILSIYQQSYQHLQQLQQVLQQLNLWQSQPPSAEAFASTEPFAIDHMSPEQWLQWIFIPRMQALIEAEGELPSQIAISPYIEEGLKETEGLAQILSPLIALEKLLQNQ